jgi:hypothetical protein
LFSRVWISRWNTRSRCSYITSKFLWSQLDGFVRNVWWNWVIVNTKTVPLNISYKSFKNLLMKNSYYDHRNSVKPRLTFPPGFSKLDKNWLLFYNWIVEMKDLKTSKLRMELLNPVITDCSRQTEHQNETLLHWYINKTGLTRCGCKQVKSGEEKRPVHETACSMKDMTNAARAPISLRFNVWQNSSNNVTTTWKQHQLRHVTPATQCGGCW